MTLPNTGKDFLKILDIQFDKKHSIFHGETQTKELWYTYQKLYRLLIILDNGSTLYSKWYDGEKYHAKMKSGFKLI
jgi:hypothetical protein